MLLFDIGNTYVKWALSENGVVEGGGQFVYAPNLIETELQNIAAHIKPPAAIAIASVAENKRAEAFTQLINQIWQIAPQFAAVEHRACGVNNAYADMEQLGIDRWLALISAWNTYKKPLCIIDCGTAITVDLVDADGRHRGGFIIPGLLMMQNSLIENTAKVAINTAKAFTLEPGRNTRDCVRNGCGLAVVGCLEQIIRRGGFDNRNQLEYILTGSDAKCIGQYLSREHHYDQELVLKGLAMLMDRG